MRRTIFVCCLCSFFLPGFSQLVSTSRTAGSGAAYNVYDFSGRPFKNSDLLDVSGSPFLYDAWKSAELDLGTGKKMVGVMVKINAYSNEIHFLTVTNEEFTTPSGLIKEIKFSDSTRQPPLVTLYQCGFPDIDDQKSESFYEVISQGKASLLKFVTKKLEERKNELSGERSRLFEAYESLYVFQNGNMKRLKKDKSSVLELMIDQKEKVNAFMASQKINFKNTESLKKVFDYYNSIAN